MAVIVLDTETTTHNKGNVYDPRNQLCLLVVKVISESSTSVLSFTKPWDVGRIHEILSSGRLLVGFNIKFYLAWCRHEFGFIPVFGTRIFDCQYAEFLFSNQTWRFPDLRTACEKRGLDPKLDYINENYWSKGIDTPDIPENELLEYCVNDVEITHQLYDVHMKMFSGEHASKYRLFRLHMLDLPVLLEMEWNGLLYNKEKSLELSESYDKQVANVERKLNEFFDYEVNWGSGPEKSTVLYGGTIIRKSHVPIGTFKSGQKIGETRYKVVETKTLFDRLVEPLQGSELATEGLWSTDEGTLRSLKTTKRIKAVIDRILERQKLEKMNGTYLKGLPKKLDEMGWGSILHPSYNNCVAVTGRVASSNPNGQNIPAVGKQLIESRF